MCCIKQACVGGIFSICRLPDENKCILAVFTSVMQEVRRYISTTKRSLMDSTLLEMSCGKLESSSNAGVTSSKAFPLSQAVLLPMPLNGEVVSHPVQEWKKGNAFGLFLPNFV